MSEEVPDDGTKAKTSKDPEMSVPTEEMANGPVADRSCTDILCCLIFIAFLVGMVGTGGYGYMYGDPKLLLTMWDADGNGCGHNGTFVDYPYLYYPTIDPTAMQNSSTSIDPAGAASQMLSFGTCVKECPLADGPVSCIQPKYMSRQADFYKDCVFSPIEYKYGGGYPFRYETELLGGKVCVPSAKALEGPSGMALKAFQEQFDKYLGGDNPLMEYVADIMACQQLLLYSLITAFLIGFIYMIVLRLCGGPIIYFSILGMILSTGYGAFMLWQTSETMDKENEQYPFYLYGSYVVAGICGVLLICAICNQKNIRVGVAVMKCTAAFIGGTPQVFLIPPIASVIVVAWLLTWVFIAAHIVSVGEIKPREDLPFLTTVEWTDETQYVFLYSLFGYLWVNAFIIGVTQFIISAACAIWYFSCTSDSNGSGSLLRGMAWVMRYHFGSIAFGAFLIALVQFIRIIFEYYRKQMEKANKDNKLVKTLLCVTSYLLDCLERFIKFISKNAYIQIALTGKNFCAAAWNAFLLIMKNAIRFGTANSIGFIFNVLGRVFITAANALVVYAALHYYEPYIGLAKNWIGPCIVAAFQGFIIGSMFMSVFSFSSDTILQSFLVDEEMKRPDGMRPAIMNQFIEGVETK